MNIDKETVKRVAFLSRLKFEDDKIGEVENEFNKILQWMGELGEVNTDVVEPLVSVNEENLVLRVDEVSEGACAKEILANAPKQEFGYFVVPKVVE